MLLRLLERAALRDWRAVTALFFTTTLLEALALGHLTAFTPLFLKDELHLPPGQIGPWTGLLSAATFAVAFPLAPFWGALAERYSRKLIVVRSQYIEAVGYILCGFAPDLGWFLAARLLLGLTFGNVAIVIASQSLLIPERCLASGIGLVQAAFPIATSVAAPLGALLLAGIGLRGLFIVDGIACLLAGLLVTFLMPEPPERDRQKSVVANMRGMFALVWRRPALRWNFLAWYLTRGSAAVVESYLPVRITELVQPDPAPAIALVLGISGLITSLVTAATGWIVDRLGSTRLLWPNMVLAVVSTLGLAFAPWLWLIAAGAWLRAVPNALGGTVLYAHLAGSVPRKDRAAVMSLTPVPRNLAAFSLPLLAAGAASVGTGAALLVAALGYAIAAWAGWQLLADRPASEPAAEGV